MFPSDFKRVEERARFLSPLAEDGFEARGYTHAIFSVPIVILREALDDGGGKAIAIHIEIMAEGKKQRRGDNTGTNMS